MKSVPGFVRSPAREQKTRESGRCWSQDQKGVTHRRRAKPFVSRDDVLLTGTAAIDGLRQGSVGSAVAASPASGHAHPEKDAMLFRSRHRSKIVDGGESPWFPFRREFRLQAERRDHGEGHGQGTTGTFVDLMPNHHQGSPRDMSSGPLFYPRQR